jgi:hypothetical protein
MFQNAKGGVARMIILGAVTLSLAAPLAAQSRKIVLPEFQTVNGLAVLSGPEGPSLTQIAALLPPATRLKPLSPEARGALRLTPLPTSVAPRLQGREEALTAGNQPVPEDLPRAVQSELKRIGCYAGGIDGDWGNGSRRAMERFYTAKKLEKGEVEPTEVVWRSLVAEAEGICQPEPVAAKKTTTKKTTTKKSGTTTKKPSEPAKKPSGGGSPNCKFIGIAIICS